MIRVLVSIIYLVSFPLISESYAQCNANILTNPGFENGFTDWQPRQSSGAAQFNTVNSTAAVGAFSAEVEVTAMGINYYDIQIKRNNIVLTAGVNYELSFYAKTVVGVEDMTYGIIRSANNSGIVSGIATLTDSWQYYSKVFTPTATESNALIFNYGDILGTFYIDQISISEYCPGQAAASSFCKTLSAPGINGTEGGVWTPAVQNDLNQIIEGNVSGAADISAYYKVIWNDNNLFLVINVQDDLKRKDSPVALAAFDDGIEIYIDTKNAKGTSYDVDDHHFLFRWDDMDIYHLSAGQINPTGAEAKSINTVGGYTYEIKLPWSLLGDFDQGNLIGIEIQVNDDDNGGNDREARIGWHATSTAVDSDPSLFGEGRLELVPCTGGNPQYTPDLCADLPDTVYHASGLIVSHEDSYWTHNDKQGVLAPPLDSMFFELDADGNFLREIYLTGIANIDWEDMTTDDDGNFYVGEFGSGNSPYSDLQIHRIKNPLYFCDTDYDVETINFRYPPGDPVGDTESMFYWNGDIYLIPKNNNTDPAESETGRAFIYKIPAVPNPGGQHIAIELFSIDLNANNGPNDAINQYKIASADLSPDGLTLVMLWGRRFYIVTDFTPGIFLDGTVTEVDFPAGLNWQREAIAFVDNTTLYTIDENNSFNPNRGKLGKIDLCDILPDLPDCSCRMKSVTDAADTSSDSAEEYANGTVKRFSSDMELTFDTPATGNQTVGLRFSNLGIPQGASIQNAYIQFTVDETDISQASSLIIWGEATTQAAAYTNDQYNVSSRQKTNASESWSFDDWSIKDVAELAHQTPNLSTIIQEITNQAAWSENNALSFIIEGQGSQTAERYSDCIRSAPRLWVEYCTVDQPCETNLTLNNQNVPAGSYQVSNQIISNGTVQNPISVEYRANTVCLNPDFEVVQGAVFHAFIDPRN